MSTLDALLEAVALHLDAEGVGAWEREPGPGESLIVAGAFLDDPVARDQVAILVDTIEDPAVLNQSTRRIQVRTRAADTTGNPGPTGNLSDAVFSALHQYGGTLPGGVTVNLVWRQSGAFLGQDAQRRWERSDNYYARGVVAGPYRV